MTDPVRTPTNTNLYARLEALPTNQVGEIISGQLHVHPRPAGPHALVASRLGADLEGPYGRGRGGPGGWWILDEPEVHFRRDQEVVVPDIGGWRVTRMPRIPRGHRFEVVPDWVCEVLSPSTAQGDRDDKMPLYARYGVAYVWLVDVRHRQLEVYRLDGKDWLRVGVFRGTGGVRVEPFAEVEIMLSDLWANGGA